MFSPSSGFKQAFLSTAFLLRIVFSIDFFLVTCSDHWSANPGISNPNQAESESNPVFLNLNPTASNHPAGH